MKLSLQDIRLPLTDFNLEINLELRGRVTAIAGPSGAGKTSLLELIAGLRRAQNGVIRLEETSLLNSSHGINVPIRERHIGYVPQDLALFPHLTARQNVLYGFKPAAAGGVLFDHVVNVLEIAPLLARRIGSLSGGEQQRIAFARALLAAPRLLLLDEPLASLDPNLKARIIPYLVRIRDEFKIPMLYVTHEPGEIRALADEVILLERGRCVRQCPPADLTGSFPL